MRNFIKLLSLFLPVIVFLCSKPGAIFAQNYLWPTDASRNLTSSFAEFRSDHFHAGIDIKTWGKEGYKVFATRDGYIWKIRVSPFGYGKVIYQVLDNGEIAVYAHLKNFSRKLDEIIYSEQKKRQRYSVSKVFQQDVLKVKKGELIAYTGRTGIGSPHLHFELRSDENTAFNPLSKNFQVKDTIPPRPTRLAVIPVNLDSQVDGQPVFQTYKIEKKSNNLYSIRKPVQIWGSIGLAIDAYDQANGVNNKYSIYGLTLYIDNMVIFRSNYRSFTYNNTGQIFLDRNYFLMSRTGIRYSNLYIEPGNTLGFYSPFIQENGIIYTAGYAKQLAPETDFFTSLLPEGVSISNQYNFDQYYLQTRKKKYTKIEPGEHQARIVLEDYFGNRSVVEIKLIAKKLNRPGNQWPESIDLIAQEFYDQNKYNWFQLSKNNSWRLLDEGEIGQNSGFLHNSDSTSIFPAGGTNSVYKIEPKQTDSSPDYPMFFAVSPEQTGSPKIELETFVQDPFTVFLISSRDPVTVPISATLQNKKLGLKFLALTTHDLNNFSASIPSFDISNDTTNFTIFSRTETGDKIVFFEKKLFYQRIDKLQKDTIKSKNGRLSLTVPVSASNRSAFFSVQNENFDQFVIPLPGDSLSPLYYISPFDVPFFKNLKLSIDLPQEALEHTHQIGIYSPNFSKKTWNFVGNQTDPEGTKLITYLKSLGYFTLIRDDKPPEIQFVRPKNGVTITNRKPEIWVRYKDNLSNIAGEDNYRIDLDGKFCISELDPELRIIKYKPREPLSVGKHSAKFWIKDRAGNQIQISIIFTIKGVP